MQISSECRWFTRSTVSGKPLRLWFFDPSIHRHAAGGGLPRVDCYLYDPDQVELGIKRRGGNSGVEIKGLVKIGRPVEVGPLRANVETWSKWSTTALALANFEIIKVAKTRWLRKFDTSRTEPAEIPLGKDEQPLDKGTRLHQGCNVEVTEIEVHGERWTTLGLEAFGDFETINDSLREVARILSTRNPPSLTDASAVSYPQWISKYCRC